MSVAAAAVDNFALTPGRIVGTIAAFVALAGVIIGWRALVRRTRRHAIIALVAGPAGMVIGGLVVALAKGGPGTGYGIVGGFAALAIGLAATILGRLALTRSPGYRKEVSTK